MAEKDIDRLQFHKGEVEKEKEYLKSEMSNIAAELENQAKNASR